MNGWDFFNTIEPSLFSLSYNKFPNDIIPNIPLLDSNMTFHSKPFGWAQAPKHPNVNPKWPSQTILDQSNIKDCNGLGTMVSSVSKPLITHCARTKSYI